MRTSVMLADDIVLGDTGAAPPTAQGGGGGGGVLSRWLPAVLPSMLHSDSFSLREMRMLPCIPFIPFIACASLVLEDNGYDAVAMERIVSANKAKAEGDSAMMLQFDTLRAEMGKRRAKTEALLARLQSDTYAAHHDLVVAVAGTHDNENNDAEVDAGAVGGAEREEEHVDAAEEAEAEAEAEEEEEEGRQQAGAGAAAADPDLDAAQTVE